MTSSDVAESLGLAVGRYEYIETQQTSSADCSATEVSPDTSLAADLSRFPADEADASATLPDSSHQDKDETETVLGDAVNVLCEKMTDDIDGDGVDRLQPDNAVIDHQLESSVISDCSGSNSADLQTNLVYVSTDINQSSSPSRNTDAVITTASDRMDHPDSDSCVDTSTEHDDLITSEGYVIKAKGVLETGGADTDGFMLNKLPKQSVNISGDVQYGQTDRKRVCQPNSASLDFKTPSYSNTRSDDTADPQQNNSPDTDTLLPTVDDLDGLLKVISRT